MEKKTNSGMFQKGKSGNPSGKSKLKPLTDRLRMILAQQPERAHKIAEALIQEAEGGNLQAAAMIFDRLEGRPTQSLEITDSRQVTELSEIDRRIEALTNRLKLGPIIDSTAEDADIVDGGTTKH
jgi:hypothetical protein